MQIVTPQTDSHIGMITIPQGTNTPPEEVMPLTTKIGHENVKDVPPIAKIGHLIVKDDPPIVQIGHKNVEDVPPTAKIGHQIVRDDPPIAVTGTQTREDDPLRDVCGMMMININHHMVNIMTNSLGNTKVDPNKAGVGHDKGLDHPTNKGQDHPAGKDPKEDHPIHPKVLLVIDLSPLSAGIAVKRDISIEIALNRKVIVPFDRGPKGKQ